MANNNPYFADKLKSWMEQQDINASQLSDIIGCSKTATYQYKDGRVPEWNFLLKLSRVMGESIEDLLDPRVGASTEEGSGAWIRLPRGHSSLSNQERQLLEDVLEIVSGDGPTGEYTKMLKQVVKTGRHGVATQKKIGGSSS